MATVVLIFTFAVLTGSGLDTLRSNLLNLSTLRIMRSASTIGDSHTSLGQFMIAPDNRNDVSMSLAPCPSVQACRSTTLARLATGDLSQAQTAARSWAALAPDDLLAQLKIADLAYLSGHKEDALEQWSRIPSSTLFLGRARRALEAGDIDLALIQLRLAYEQRNRLTEVPQQRALGALLRQATASMPSSSSTRVEVLSWASDVYLETWQRDQNQIEFLLLWGITWRERGAPERALSAFRQVNQLTTRPMIVAQAYGETAITYQQQHKWELAIEAYNKALQVVPTIIPYHISRAVSYRESGCSPCAFRDLDQAAMLSQQSSPGTLAWIAAERGWTHASIDDWPKAINDFEQAVKLAPNNPTYAQYLAQGKEATGQVEEAIAMYQKALELNPHNEFVQVRLKTLRMEQ